MGRQKWITCPPTAAGSVVQLQQGLSRGGVHKRAWAPAGATPACRGCAARAPPETAAFAVSAGASEGRARGWPPSSVSDAGRASVRRALVARRGTGARGPRATTVAVRSSPWLSNPRPLPSRARVSARRASPGVCGGQRRGERSVPSWSAARWRGARQHAHANVRPVCEHRSCTRALRGRRRGGAEREVQASPAA